MIEGPASGLASGPASGPAPGLAQAPTEELTDGVRRILHAHGQRMTVPRAAVLQALVRRGGHVGADQVVADVEAAGAGVHRSSVYRTLEALAGAGVLQHVHLGHGGTAYHLLAEPHPHGQCSACGAVVDLPADALDALGRDLRRTAGFHLDPLHVAVSGRCAACARARARAREP